ncbi:uncharacterized protein [Gorilla gorilla gorilla]|uniref:uncharacterized protein isoform X2 n=1 Tax=Gorilla gorilla gorilla TaxID=9595 RepID=UPI003009922F
MSLGDAAVNSSHSMSKEHWLKFVFSPGWLSKHFTDCVKPDLRAGTVRKVMSSTLKWRRGTFFVFHQPQGYSKSISLYLPGWEPRGLVPEVCVPNPLNEIDKTVHIRHCNEDYGGFTTRLESNSLGSRVRYKTHQTVEDSPPDWEETAWAPESATCPCTDKERFHEASVRSGTLALFVRSCFA